VISRMTNHKFNSMSVIVEVWHVEYPGY